MGSIKFILDVNLDWAERFETFGLDGIVDDFPQSAEGVYAALTALQAKMSVAFNDWLQVDYGMVPEPSAKGIETVV